MSFAQYSDVVRLCVICYFEKADIARAEAETHLHTVHNSLDDFSAYFVGVIMGMCCFYGY